MRYICHPELRSGLGPGASEDRRVIHRKIIRRAVV